MTTSSPPQPDIRSLLESGFNEETARALYAQGEAVVVFALLELAALAVKTQDINGTHPSTPSATVAAYQKEPGKKRKKRPGAKPRCTTHVSVPLCSRSESLPAPG